MKTLTFIRHGQSVANAGGITMAHDAIPLTELGRLQAQALAAVLDLRPSKVYVSAYDRTAETAAPFCARVGVQPEVHPTLHEFSTIDPVLLAGMNGEQRRPIADEFWKVSDPQKRMGPAAETYAEFDARVRDFMPELDRIPDGTVMFGHGMWFGLLVWKLLGFDAADGTGMRAFRRFQLGLPMPNCATYKLIRGGDGQWRARVDEALLRHLASVDLNPRN